MNILFGKYSLQIVKWRTKMTDVVKYDFDYNVSLKTINCINSIDFTYHVNSSDYPIMHSHLDYFEFTIVTKGSILNITKDKEELVEENSLFIALSNSEHYFLKKSKEISYITIVCRKKVLDELNQMFGCDLFKLFNEINKIRLDVDLIFSIKSNIEYVNSLTEDEWEKCNDILKSTVISIVNYIYVNNIKTNFNSEKWEIILNNLKQDPKFYSFNVNQLCDSLGYSRTQLNRIFISKYEMTPYDYLINIKMKYAQSLLSHTDYKVSEISKMVGYTTINQFNKNFEKVFHKTPLEYRNQKEK